MSADRDLGERTLLVTLGSPFEPLSRVFRGSIRTPADILGKLHGDRRIAFWANLWRDGDMIGRSLDLSALWLPAAEMSLGPGAHRNYWSDARLWRAVRTLMSAMKRGRFDSQGLAAGQARKSGDRRTDSAARGDSNAQALCDPFWRPAAGLQPIGHFPVALAGAWGRKAASCQPPFMADKPRLFCRSCSLGVSSLEAAAIGAPMAGRATTVVQAVYDHRLPDLARPWHNHVVAIDVIAPFRGLDGTVPPAAGRPPPVYWMTRQVPSPWRQARPVARSVRPSMVTSVS